MASNLDPVAQRTERPASTRDAEGSNPSGVTNLEPLAQRTELRGPNARVGGSNPPGLTNLGSVAQGLGQPVYNRQVESSNLSGPTIVVRAYGHLATLRQGRSFHGVRCAARLPRDPAGAQSDCKGQSPTTRRSSDPAVSSHLAPNGAQIGAVSPAAIAALIMLGLLLFAISLGAANICSYSVSIRNAPGDDSCPGGSASCFQSGNPIPAYRANRNFINESQLCDWAASLTVEQLGSQCTNPNNYLVWSGSGWSCTPIWEEAGTGGLLGVVSLASGGSGSVVARDNDPRMALAASALQSVPAASTLVAGVVRLAIDGGTTTGRVPGADDSRLALAGTSIQPGNSALTNSRTPSGAAGNGLAGTYPNPSIASPASIDITGNAATATTASGPAASTSTPGLVRLEVDGGTTAGRAVQPNDSRLSNARNPAGSASGALTGSYPSPGLASPAAVSITGNAATAGAFDHDPDDCPDGEVAVGIGADGAATCIAAPSGGGGGVAGPVASTDAALARWNGTDGSAIADSGVSLGNTSEHRLTWGNAAGFLESGGGLWLKSSGVDYAWELSIAGHLCAWNATNAPCLRNNGSGGPTFSFNSDSGLGMGRTSDGALGLYGGRVRIDPLPTNPGCSNEGDLWANSAQHTLCYCNGTSWSRAAGSLTGTCP